MKTKQLRILLKELSDLNNSFTHYFFVWAQFSLDYGQLMATNKEQRTSDVFKDNHFSEKHNIQLSNLNEEHTKTNKTLLNGIFTLIYSSFENYLTGVYELSKAIDNSLPQLNEGNYAADDVLVLKVLNRLRIKKEAIENRYLLTLDYIRLKRNRLVHQSSPNISRSLREVIKKEGVELNLFWNQILPKKLQGMDFSDAQNADEITMNILIDILNIFRGISSYIDKLILGSFRLSQFLEKEVLVEFKKNNGFTNYNIADERNKKRFVGFCKTEYGFEPTEYDFQEMV